MLVPTDETAGNIIGDQLSFTRITTTCRREDNGTISGGSYPIITLSAAAIGRACLDVNDTSSAVSLSVSAQQTVVVADPPVVTLVPTAQSWKTCTGSTFVSVSFVYNAPSSDVLTSTIKASVSGPGNFSGCSIEGSPLSGE
jgi:hypothetical protein